MATIEISKQVYEHQNIVQRYALKLIEDLRYISEGLDPGGAAIWHELFGNADHRDPEWTAAFNAARFTPEYAFYLSREMNDSMFDDGFGDVLERSCDSIMCSAFANMMADRVLRLLGERMAEGIGQGTIRD